MSAEPVEPPRALSFRDASPWEVRAALIPEEQPDFDRQWRKTPREAVDPLDRAEARRVLDSWRRRTMITTHLGSHGYRNLLARAEETLRAGEPPADSVSLDEIKQLIEERLAR